MLFGNQIRDAQEPCKEDIRVPELTHIKVSPNKRLLGGLLGTIPVAQLSCKMGEQESLITPDKITKIVRMTVKATLDVIIVCIRHF
jgi:hypothetical protein